MVVKSWSISFRTPFFLSGLSYAGSLLRRSMCGGPNDLKIITKMMTAVVDEANRL